MQQSTDTARHLIGTAEPLVGEIVPAVERVTVPESAPTSPAPSPAPAPEIITPTPAPAPTPTSWEWTAGPAPIEITIPNGPEVPEMFARIQHGMSRPHLPISVLLSMGTTITGVLWAALTSTHAHPAAIEAVATAAVGLVATIGTTAAEVCRDGR